jgi:hypothetical protein
MPRLAPMFALLLARVFVRRTERAGAIILSGYPIFIHISSDRKQVHAKY